MNPFPGQNVHQLAGKVDFVTNMSPDAYDDKKKNKVIKTEMFFDAR